MIIRVPDITIVMKSATIYGPFVMWKALCKVLYLHFLCIHRRSERLNIITNVFHMDNLRFQKVKRMLELR
jgi:hypothetical protein